MYDDSFVHHNLKETPLHLRTNSRLGSEDRICINTRKDFESLQSPLRLCINFKNIIYIGISHDHDQCKSNVIPVTTYAATQDRTWTITKTAISYQITGNDIEPLELTFNSLHCGKIAKTMNFGWLQFRISLEGVSTAHYFETASK
jgi:hypothetical protein